MKTFLPKEQEIQKKWYLIDADRKILGKLAVEIATILRGKKKPLFTPHLDVGDYVIVINAEKVKLTGGKLKNKTYYDYSGYPGGLKAETAETLIKRKPEKIIEYAVKGMLPKNKLGRALFKKLKVYRGAEHPHEAQMPEVLNFNRI